MTFVIESKTRRFKKEYCFMFQRNICKICDFVFIVLEASHKSFVTLLKPLSTWNLLFSWKFKSSKIVQVLGNEWCFFNALEGIFLMVKFVKDLPKTSLNYAYVWNNFKCLDSIITHSFVVDYDVVDINIWVMNNLSILMFTKNKMLSQMWFKKGVFF